MENSNTSLAMAEVSQTQQDKFEMNQTENQSLEMAKASEIRQ